MKPLGEEETLDFLVSIFGWDDSVESRYHALVILRGARREPIPTFDDFKVGRDRTKAA